MMGKTKKLSVEKLSVSVNEKKVLEDLSLCFHAGEIVALVGKNGSGKTSLGNALLEHPGYTVLSGSAYIQISSEQVSLFSIPLEDRCAAGLVVSRQEAVHITGIRPISFLKILHENLAIKRGNGLKTDEEWNKYIRKLTDWLDFPYSLLERGSPQDFSGGEKKKLELIQLIVLEPEIVILDEIDAGLDIDFIRILVEVIFFWKSKGVAVCVISHYPEFLQLLNVKKVYVIGDGKLIQTGNKDLLKRIMEDGYKNLSTSIKEECCA